MGLVHSDTALAGRFAGSLLSEGVGPSFICMLIAFLDDIGNFPYMVGIQVEVYSWILVIGPRVFREARGVPLLMVDRAAWIRRVLL